MVRHIMADGREVDDITGYVVPLNDKTRFAYEVLIDEWRKEQCLTELRQS